MLGRHTDLMQCRTVGWQPVGNDLIGRVSLLLQQSAHQLESRLLVCSGLHEDIERLMVVYGSLSLGRCSLAANNIPGDVDLFEPESTDATLLLSTS